ncbi:hypothetical protein GDO81_001630 [Engystomops pustulosus]|uniref:Uncharacterized protein n=1 Tax=Engystomops pustulosus TaxID=76066 RepID=A0AAV7DEY4_ENGPU|nr:hypothetical protein GDO81_001630 [Engystomops pustulosus]
MNMFLDLKSVFILTGLPSCVNSKSLQDITWMNPFAFKVKQWTVFCRRLDIQVQTVLFLSCLEHLFPLILWKWKPIEILHFFFTFA